MHTRRAGSTPPPCRRRRGQNNDRRKRLQKQILAERPPAARRCEADLAACVGATAVYCTSTPPRRQRARRHTYAVTHLPLSRTNTRRGACTFARRAPSSGPCFTCFTPRATVPKCPPLPPPLPPRRLGTAAACRPASKPHWRPARSERAKTMESYYKLLLCEQPKGEAARDGVGLVAPLPSSLPSPLLLSVVVSFSAPRSGPLRILRA